MELKLILTFIISAIVLMVPEAAAEIVTNWTCNVTRVRDGVYRYQLSRPSECKMGWEDVNKTSYAHEFEFDPQRVHNVTREHILLKSCQDYMHFTDDCLKHDAVEEVHCRVNCTLLLSLTVPERHQPPSVPNSGICFSEGWCVAWRDVQLVAGCLAVVVLLAVVISVFIRRHVKRRRGESSQEIEYTPATGEIKVQMEMNMDQL